MANLQQFGRNQSRTTGLRSNKNPRKFVELKQSSHTWGPGAPPPSLRLPAKRKKKKEEESERASARPAFEFVRSGGGAQNAALSSPAARRAAFARDAFQGVLAGAEQARPGPRGSTLLPGGGDAYSIAAPGAEAEATAKTKARASASPI